MNINDNVQLKESINLLEIFINAEGVGFLGGGRE